ncbi:hypothetical protein, partial [Pararhodonellum marinum]|uniref:hypothetical protein n=1 Tax=Pararhodonellum marinum TaxID=2755358 RepID=UPI001E63DB74
EMSGTSFPDDGGTSDFGLPTRLKKNIGALAKKRITIFRLLHFTFYYLKSAIELNFLSQGLHFSGQQRLFNVT